MALLFADGFNDLSSSYSHIKWDFRTNISTLAYSSDRGPLGGYGAYIYHSAGHYLYNNIANTETIICGIRIRKVTHQSGNPFISFYDEETKQCEIRILLDGSLQFYRGTTLIASSTVPNLIKLNRWAYFEIKVKLSNTVGTVEVRVDGVTVLSATGLDNCTTANEYCTQYRVAGDNSSDTYVSDFYACDGTGTECNDFLGDVSVESLLPVADGTHSDFIPSTGTDHYALIDEAYIANEDDYNESDTIGHKDTYDFATLATEGTIHAVVVNSFVRNTDVGTMNIRALSRSGAVPADNESADHILSQSLETYQGIFEKEPTDDVSWTVAKINAAEFGIKVES